MTEITLASASPRRQELLRIICKSFAVCPAEIDETLSPNMPMKKAAAQLARRKAQAVYKLCGGVVIGADTLVVIDDTPLGKPQDRQHAAQMLQQLSGRTHEVWTPVAVVGQNTDDLIMSVTKVKFYPLTEEQITRYLETDEAMDKAGAYGIQGQGALFVQQITGDFYGVMGLPVAPLAQMLRKHEIIQ